MTAEFPQLGCQLFSIQAAVLHCPPFLTYLILMAFLALIAGLLSFLTGFTPAQELLLMQQLRAALFIKIHPQAAGRFIIGTAMGA